MESLQRVVGEMAESRTVAVAPLNGSNYVTWRAQCKMALMKEGLWNIVCGTEVAPGEGDAGYRKFVGRRDNCKGFMSYQKIGSKWVFKVKTNENGDVERYKARLVAQGFMQVKGADYDETFCPVVWMESLRALVAMSVRISFKLHQLDITTAFLNGNLEEEVFMTQPEGFVIQGKQDI